VKGSEKLTFSKDIRPTDFGPNDVVSFTIKQPLLGKILTNPNCTTCIRHQCRKTIVLSCHRCLNDTGIEKNEQHLNEN